MVRKATINDLNGIMEIYRGAQKFMAETGNPNQWGTFYPAVSDVENDLQKEQLYVVVREDRLCGVFMFAIGEDPFYMVIDGGQWLDSKTAYGVIHRIAAKTGEKGIFKEAVEFARSCISHLRIDTHADNKIMQHIIEKNGFKRCGIIYVHERKSPRIAFEWIK